MRLAPVLLALPLLLAARIARADVKVEDPEKYHQQGLDYMRDEKWNLAVDALQKSIDAKADDFRVWIDLGDALAVDPRGIRYGDAARNEKAADAYRKAIDLNPGAARAWNNLAWLWAKSGATDAKHLDEALAAAKRAVEIDGSKTGYLDTLAEVHYARGEKKEAIDAEDQALAMSPDDDYLKKQRGRFESALEAATPAPTPAAHGKHAHR